MTLEQWTSQLKSDVEATTKEVKTDIDTEQMDSRLAHLLEAKQSMLTRWKGHRLNRRLRKRIAMVNQEIEDHCRVLSKQQWDELCNSFDGRIKRGGAWSLLKHLLDQTKTKSNQRTVIGKLVHQSCRDTTEEKLLKDLADRYLPLETSQDTRNVLEYSGDENKVMDEEFTESDRRVALQDLTGRSAPGPDGITNKMLRNLDEGSIAFLTREINKQWKEGSFPEEWKLATTVLIPKPGKAIGIDNLRPISLTSCLGKVAEHVILNRLTRYVEGKGVLPHSMIGFRPGLSTQDAMIRIKHQLLDRRTRDTKVLLGLDVEKAFDNIHHSYILQVLSDLNLGQRLFHFVKAFLMDRRTCLRFGELKSEVLKLGCRGTPQGSVLSPMLFNMAMLKLSNALDTVQVIGYTIYADDITIWSAGGSDGELEARLQEVMTLTEECLDLMGLKCSSKKSEMLIFKSKKPGRRPKDWVPEVAPCITIHARDGSLIPKVEAIRVLGLIIEATGSNNRTIQRITKKTEEAVRLIRRISNRHRGLGEEGAMRLVHAFVMCHFSYVAAMLNWNRGEKAKLDALIRKAVKTALGLPVSTSNDMLLRLGLHNTLDEIAEAQRTAQRERLLGTPAGRYILKSIGESVAESHGGTRLHELNVNIRANIIVHPFPRNVHPVHNVGRRMARARALLQEAEDQKEESAFVDAAWINGKDAYSVVVVDGKGSVRNAASVYTKDPGVAEQVAIALALTDSDRVSVFSDSRSAIKAFSRGLVAEQAYRLLQGRDITSHTVTWFPAHMGSVEGAPRNLNEVAHREARGLVCRALPEGAGPLVPEFRDHLLTYNEITKHYYLGRRAFPLPHYKLHRPQAITLRLLQTRTYPNPVIMNKINPDCGVSVYCSKCGGLVDLDHRLWRCSALAGDGAQGEQWWQRMLHSEVLTDQLRAVQRARVVAEELGLSVPTWERPASVPTD